MIRKSRVAFAARPRTTLGRRSGPPPTRRRSGACRRTRSARRRRQLPRAASVVNRSRPLRVCRSRSSSSPGSANGAMPRESSATFSGSLSTPSTSKPSSARQAACVAPRYPVPMTLSRMAGGLLMPALTPPALVARSDHGGVVEVHQLVDHVRPRSGRRPAARLPRQSPRRAAGRPPGSRRPDAATSGRRGRRGARCEPCCDQVEGASRGRRDHRYAAGLGLLDGLAEGLGLAGVDEHVQGGEGGGELGAAEHPGERGAGQVLFQPGTERTVADDDQPGAGQVGQLDESADLLLGGQPADVPDDDAGLRPARSGSAAPRCGASVRTGRGRRPGATRAGSALRGRRAGRGRSTDGTSVREERRWIRDTHLSMTGSARTPY